MRCPECGNRFAVNWQVACSPGGQESPGTFTILGAVFFVPALVCLLAGFWLVALALIAISGFVWLQAIVAWFDCRDAVCPDCKAKVTVFPWSL